MEDNPEECPVCWTVFDDSVQRPHNLPCGHTFCTLCVNDIEKQRQVTCPTCRANHDVPEAGQFPICYTLESIIRRLRGASGSPQHRAGKLSGVAGRDGRKEKGGLSRKMRSLLQEQESKVLAAISICQEGQSQLGQYKVTLAGWSKQQEQLEDRLQALTDLVKSVRMLVRQEEYQVTVKEEQMQQREQLLHLLLEALYKVNTVQEACKAIDDADQCISKTEQGMEECQEMFPGMNTVTAVRKLRGASGEALEAIHTVQASMQTNVPAGGAEESGILANPASVIPDRLQALLTPTVKVEDLRSLRQPTRSLLEAGLVVAVNQVEGRHRHARISFENNQLYLHALQDQPPPLGAATLEVDEMALPSPPCVAFLDLAWPGSEQHRVLIHISFDNPRGRQFAMLCTGQRGPSYANTRLCGVGNKGMPGEWVWGGDYDRNNGEGGAALLPDLDQGQYLRSGRPGDVWGVWGGNPGQGAQFGINTTERRDGYLFYGVFGKVVSGLDAVAAAAAARITEVTVVDCGVLWRKCLTS